LDQDTLSAPEDYREELFAHAVAFGTPPQLALRQAGYENLSPALAGALLRKSSVQATIEKDQEWFRSKIATSKEFLAAQLDADREFAYGADNPGAAIQATMGKARLLGHLDGASSKSTPSKIVIEWGTDSQEVIHPQETLVQGLEEEI
jgi:hypothetical protein